ncbi:MAG: sporulation protein YqfD [Moorellales bacterium]
MRNWQAFLGGYVVLSVTGTNPERLLNLALSRGLVLWDARWAGSQRLYLKARPQDVFPLRHLARQSRCRLRLVARRGLPFLANRLRRRPGFLAGALFFLLALYVAGSFVWVVEVKFPEPVRYNRGETVLEQARVLGLRPGAWRSGLDPQALSRQLAQRLPNIAWVGVHLQGVKATVEVVERVLPPASVEAAHIVAAKAGLIEEVLVVRGEARVKPGEVVRAGQVLISGIIRTPTGGAVVRAEGLVRARVWYRARAVVPLVEVREVATGRTRATYRLRVADREVRLWGPPGPPFQLYRVEAQCTGPVLLGTYRLPLSLTRITYSELRREEIRRTPAEAKELARQQARKLLADQIPPSARLVDLSLEAEKTLAQAAVVEAVAETREEIGQLYPLATGSGSPSRP